MQYWLVKSEPVKYSWDQFVQDGSTHWDGVRNYTARNNLRAMKKGDKVCWYHSNEGLEIVGIAEVMKEAYPDPSTEDERWCAVDLKPVKKLERSVSLATMKGIPQLAEMDLIRLSRLSVGCVKKAEYDIIIKLSNEAR